jgi:hypothetical protein
MKNNKCKNEVLTDPEYIWSKEKIDEIKSIIDLELSKLSPDELKEIELLVKKYNTL